MLDNNNPFAPEKISILEFKMVKGQVDTPENFDQNKVGGYHVDNGLQLGYNVEDKLIKADFTIAIKTESKGKNESESDGNFHLVFIYRVENFEELAKPGKKKLIEIHPELGSAIASVTYSTARGILLTRLQGTALQNFVLPIINPNTLLHKQG